MSPIPPTVSLIGFDSAWADNPSAPGALAVIRIAADGCRRLVAPELVSFDRALALIEAEAAVSALRIVAIDQPTIVPNAVGMRAVDRVAASLVAWLGGGVQPANRGRTGLFDEAAPIWRFKNRLGAVEDPEASRSAARGLYLMEVFPALAWPSLDPGFCGRRRGPRYNPARRGTFSPNDWRAVAAVLQRFGEAQAVAGLADLAGGLAALPAPRKADQDRLDALACACIGLLWHTAPRRDLILLGDLRSGFIAAPAAPPVRARLEAAAAALGVAVDGRISPGPGGAAETP